MMKTVVFYYSVYGNTQQVAQAVADALREHADVRLAELGGLSAGDLREASLVVAGAPTHNMNLPSEVRYALDALPKRCLAGKACVAFDTSYEMSRWLRPFTAAPKLAQKLKKLGGEIVIAPERFLIERDHQGPLQAGELDRASQWAHAILERMGVRRAAA